MTVTINPPGDSAGRARRGVLARARRVLRTVTAAVWLGFNVEQLSRLQRVGARSHPLRHHE